MKQILLRRLFDTLGVFLGLAPAFLLAGSALTSDRAALWLVPLGCALAAAFAARLLASRGRAAGAAAAAALAALAGILFCRRTGIASWGPLGAVLCAAAEGLHLLFLSRRRDEFNAAALWALGFVGYILVRIIGAMANLSALPPLLHRCIGAYIVFSLAAFALESLENGMGGGKGPSRPMVLRDISAALGLSMLTLLLSNLNAVGQALKWFFRQIAAFFLWLGNLLPSSSEQAASGGPENMLSGLPAAGEPSALMLFLEKAIRILGLILAAAAALALAAALVRGLARLARRVLRWLKTYAGTVTDAYDDTVESLLDWGEVRLSLQRRKKAAPLPGRMQYGKETDPRLQLRRSYRIFLSRHPEIPACRTARDSLNDPSLSSLYEKARYSREPVTADEAEAGRRMENE